MKTLLTTLLIFFCLTARGQEIVYDRSGNAYTGNLEELNALTVTGYKYDGTDTAYFVSITMTDLLDYAQECYADSSLRCRVLYTDYSAFNLATGTYPSYNYEMNCGEVENIFRIAIESDIQVDSFYIHKEPTLSEFIKWSKLKYGVK